MILTGQCENDFKEWAKVAYTDDVYCISVGWENGYNDISDLIIKFQDSHYNPRLPESMYYALIVDFMDSKGMLISTKKSSFYLAENWKFELDLEFEYHKQTGLSSRTEALKAAIERANSIYNEQKQ